MNSVQNALRQIKVLYSSLNPLEPEQELIKIVRSLLPCAKGLINSDVVDNKENFVCIGYYSADITTCIGRLSSLQDSKILFMNMLGIEFISDFLLFTESPDKEHFKYFFSKYMRNIEQANCNFEASAMYNEIYNRYNGKKGFDYRRYLNQAAVGNIFLLLHEWVHLDSNLINSAIQLFRLDSTKKFFGERTDIYLREVACDFSAFKFIAELVKENNLFVTKKETLDVVLFQVLMSSLYDSFAGLLLNMIGNPNYHLEGFISNLNAVTQERLQDFSIVIKIAGNSGLLDSDFDISASLDKTRKGMGAYLNNLAEFFGDELLSEIELFNSRQVEVSNFDPKESKSVWSIFL